MNTMVTEIDLKDIMDLYQRLGIEATQNVDVESLSKEYQELMAHIEKEALTTTVYISR